MFIFNLSGFYRLDTLSAVGADSYSVLWQLFESIVGHLIVLLSAVPKAVCIVN